MSSWDIRRQAIKLNGQTRTFAYNFQGCMTSLTDIDGSVFAYRITGEGASRAIAGRLGGATHGLVPTSEGYLYTSPLFTIQLSKDLAPLAAPVPAAPDASGPADLLFAATLHTLLTSIAPSQLPPVP